MEIAKGMEALTNIEEKMQTLAAETVAAKSAQSEAEAKFAKLEKDLIRQEKDDRVAYAHTNPFFIMEENMGRFYRDTVYGADLKKGY